KPKRLFPETTTAWVDDPGAPTFLTDGSFLLPSERTGWKHLYHFDKDGKLKQPITSGNWEMRTLHRCDEEGGWIYFSGTRDSSIASNLYRVRLDGSQLERVQIQAPDGFVLEGSLLKPADFHPERRYPVWFMTYGGPHAPTIHDSWNPRRANDEVLAHLGFLVFRCDPRSASGKGACST